MTKKKVDPEVAEALAAGDPLNLDVKKPRQAKVEEPIKWNVGQKRVLKKLEDKAVREVLVAAGSRCFTGDTPVRMANGALKPIKDIQEGEYVLSVNLKTGRTESRAVEIKFKKERGQTKQMITFVLSSGTLVKCTREHEIYTKKERLSAAELAGRAMEDGNWDRRTLRSEQFGAIEDTELEVYWRNRSDDPRPRRKRIYADDGEKEGREVSHGKDSQASRRGMATEPREERTGEPYQQRQGGQPGGKFGVVYSTGELSAHDAAGSADLQQWREERDGYHDRGVSTADTEGIRPNQNEKVRVGKVFRDRGSRVTGRGVWPNLEAREIDLDEIQEIHYWRTAQPVYDICVYGNHNYLVTEDNLLVSNSGKTFMFISIIVSRAILFPNSRHMIARKWFSHAKASVWLDTLPAVINKMVPSLKPLLTWNNTDFFLQFPNGSQIWVAGLDDKEKVDKILGREYMTIFFNEASEISYDVYTTVCTRLAQKCSRSWEVVIGGKTVTKTEEGVNRIFIDENPPSAKHWTKVLFVDKLEPESRNKVKKPEKYLFEQIHPWENEENVSSDYLERLQALPESKRRRFYDGKFGDDSQYALWDTATIAKNRVFEYPPLRRIVVAVDPAVSKKDTSDETGIVVKGVGYNNHCYLLEDLTGKYSPNEWAEKAVEAYHRWRADHIVAEVNNGGDLVETVIRTVDKRVPYTGVHATRDKYTRAEPVAALAAQGVDHHVGEFPEMEEEQTSWEGKKGEPSPNRIDANVWATYALLPEMTVWRGGQIGGNFAAAMRGDYVADPGEL